MLKTYGVRQPRQRNQVRREQADQGPSFSLKALAVR